MLIKGPKSLGLIKTIVLSNPIYFTLPSYLVTHLEAAETERYMKEIRRRYAREKAENEAQILLKTEEDTEHREAPFSWDAIVGMTKGKTVNLMSKVEGHDNTTQTTKFQVAVTEGYNVQAAEVYKNLELKIQDHKIQQRLYLFDLGGANWVLEDKSFQVERCFFPFELTRDMSFGYKMIQLP